MRKSVVFAVFAVILSAAMAVSADKARIYKMGETVSMKNSDWVIISMETMGITLFSQNQFAKNLKSSGHFIKIKFIVKNKTIKEQSLRSISPIVIDNKKREYNNLASELLYLPSGSKVIDLIAIPPGLAREYVSIFEIPDDATIIYFSLPDLLPLNEMALVSLEYLTPTQPPLRPSATPKSL